MFECRKCGKCCTLFHMFPEGDSIREALDSGDGICRYFDRESRLCSIYESRPIICNHARYYDEYLKDRMTCEEFDVFLNTFCERIRSDDV
ncbi:MAG: YkgJ family cysteine cluster protein [Synergistaceae bacterium]|nr:YkgJ family cysteine cluster protein [Synergistaceae bacterium]